jgi:Undecaprenyl-phosphate glucose phosphotransferase
MYHFFRRHPEHGYRFLGFFSENGNGDSQIIGKVEEVKKFALEHDVDEIYCSLPDLTNERVHDLIDFCEKNLVRFRLLPDFRGFDNRQVDISFYDTIPVLTVRREPLENFSNRVVKRTFDIVFSSLVILLVFTWLVPLIAFLIKLSSKGPVFFKQLRSGRDNRPFMCYKFRSMRVNTLADELQATKNDPRITAIGKFLRKTSLDELPQFYNVLIGNMSVVGPRPHMLRHTEEYSKIVDTFMVRHFVKPGITGLAQVSGFRGETTDPLLMHKRVENDVWYIENWSFFLDLKIILLTIWTILKGDKNAF